MGKLITGWWKTLGLDIQYSVEDNGTLIDGGYHSRATVQARLRHVHLGVAAQRVRPGAASRLLPHRADREPERRLLVEQGVRRRWLQQSKELDAQKRKAITYQMQEILYKQSPYIILTYPKLLEAWNTEKWEGWKRIPQPNGAVAYISDNVSNYFNVAPRAAETTTSTSSGSNTTLLIVVVVVVVVVVGILLLRRRPKAEGLRGGRFGGAQR